MEPFEKLVVNHQPIIPVKFGQKSMNGCIGDVKIAMLT